MVTSQGVDWEKADGKHGDDAEAEDFEVHMMIDGIPVSQDADFSVYNKVACEQRPDGGFHELRALLVDNYAWLQANGKVEHLHNHAARMARCVSVAS
jgi:hypothetical protein